MGKDFISSIYWDTRTVAEALLEASEEELNQMLQEEFGIELPDKKLDPNSNDLQRGSFGLSYLIADKQPGEDDILYSERAEDFREFIEELGCFSSGYKTSHLIQYSNLYRQVAEDKGLDTSGYSDSTMILKDKEDIEEEVLDMLSDIAKQIEDEALA